MGESALLPPSLPEYGCKLTAARATRAMPAMSSGAVRPGRAARAAQEDDISAGASERKERASAAGV